MFSCCPLLLLSKQNSRSRVIILSLSEDVSKMSSSFFFFVFFFSFVVFVFFFFSNFLLCGLAHRTFLFTILRFCNSTCCLFIFFCTSHVHQSLVMLSAYSPGNLATFFTQLGTNCNRIFLPQLVSMKSPEYHTKSPKKSQYGKAHN